MTYNGTDDRATALLGHCLGLDLLQRSHERAPVLLTVRAARAAYVRDIQRAPADVISRIRSSLYRLDNSRARTLCATKEEQQPDLATDVHQIRLNVTSNTGEEGKFTFW